MKYLLLYTFLLMSVLAIAQTTKIDFYQFNQNNDTILKNKVLYIDKDFYRMDVLTKNYQSSVIENFASDTLVILIHHTKTYSYHTKGDLPPKKLRTRIRTRCDKKETKSILNYNCFRCTIKEKFKIEGKTQDLELWYTTEIANLEIKKELDYKDIPGVVLEINNLNTGKTTRAVSIYNINDDTINKIPEGYQFF